MKRMDSGGTGDDLVGDMFCKHRDLSLDPRSHVTEISGRPVRACNPALCGRDDRLLELADCRRCFSCNEVLCLRGVRQAVTEKDTDVLFWLLCSRLHTHVYISDTNTHMQTHISDFSEIM